MKSNTLKHFLSSAAPWVAALGLVTFIGCSSSSKSNPPPATKTIYTGTLYMASEMGGHIAMVPVTIDPSNLTTPITVGPLDKIQLDGTPSSNNHIFHDVRYDAATNRVYYSTIMMGGDNKTHVGWADPSTKSVHDSTIDYTTTNTMVYCGSGQTADYFIPMTMSNLPYIDAIKKSALTSGGATLNSATYGTDGNVKRTFVSQFRVDNPNYAYVHGMNSPDESKMYVAVNEADAPDGTLTGSFTGYLLKMSDLVGPTDVTTTAVIASKTITTSANSVAFRSTFTPLGDKILQAGADRFVVLDGTDLHQLINDTNIGGSYAANTGSGGFQNHDVMPTPDGKYAILSVRFQYVDGASQTQDSGLQLYDLTAGKAIGDPVSTCNKCHNPSNPADPSLGARHTCGVDGKLTSQTVNQ